MHEDAVWDALARALAGEYEIVARLGLGSGGAPVYLARELITDTLVALRLPPLESDTAAREFGLEVVRQIDGSLPGIETRCSHCSAVVRQWSRFCSICGGDISGLAPAAGGKSRETLRRLARETAAGKYDVIGEMTRVEGGGMVYFGRELTTGQVVGLQLETGPDATLLVTATPFATPDPRIQLPEARHASGEQISRRVSVSHREPWRDSPPAAANNAARGTWRVTRMGIVTAAILALVLVVLLVYRLT